jgi:hypothetical protein
MRHAHTIPPKSFDILLQFRKATAVQNRNLMLEGGRSHRQQRRPKKAQGVKMADERQGGGRRQELVRHVFSASACCANELITYNL